MESWLLTRPDTLRELVIPEKWDVDELAFKSILFPRSLRWGLRNRNHVVRCGFSSNSFDSFVDCDLMFLH